GGGAEGGRAARALQHSERAGTGSQARGQPQRLGSEDQVTPRLVARGPAGRAQAPGNRRVTGLISLSSAYRHFNSGPRASHPEAPAGARPGPTLREVLKPYRNAAPIHRKLGVLPERFVGGRGVLVGVDGGAHLGIVEASTRGAGLCSSRVKCPGRFVKPPDPPGHSAIPASAIPTTGFADGGE